MSSSSYHYATGLEALFGYLYLCGRMDRLRELFYIISENWRKTDE
jgi:ribonuclease-3 family protein